MCQRCTTCSRAICPAPSAANPKHDTLDGWVDATMPKTGWWANGRAYMISLLRMWYGNAATAENQWGYDNLPKAVGDHSHIPMFKAMVDGVVKGFMCIGQNPAAGGQNAIYNRMAMANLDWLVIRDLFRIETAEFWKAPDVPDPSVIQTEVFFLPSTSVTESEGSFTNTQRLLQWHDKGAEPQEDCRSDLWFSHHLYKRLRKMYEGSTDPRDAAFLAMTWYTNEEPGPLKEPSAINVLREINGWHAPDRTPLKTFVDIKADGSTPCGVWIYTGVYPAEGVNKAQARVSDAYTSLGWGWAWPANRRTLYNRASADPQGKPWSPRKAYVWWDREAKEVGRLRYPGLPGDKGANVQRRMGERRHGRARRHHCLHHAARWQSVFVHAIRDRRRPVTHALRALGIEHQERAVPDPAQSRGESVGHGRE